MSALSRHACQAPQQRQQVRAALGKLLPRQAPRKGGPHGPMSIHPSVEVVVELEAEQLLEDRKAKDFSIIDLGGRPSSRDLLSTLGRVLSDRNDRSVGS